MKPIDKFGKNIYPHIFKIIISHGKVLSSLGYRESKSKPNLFFHNTSKITFFADMRGSDEIKIWENTAPLFYWQWNTHEALTLSKKQKLVYNEWKNIESAQPRLSHDVLTTQSEQATYEAQLIFDNQNNL